MKHLIFAALPILAAGCTPEPARMVSIDDMLHRPDARHGTFGPTGKRLFTERLDEGLGVRGQFCYIHHADIRDPILLELYDRNERLAQQIERSDWYPSHLTTQSKIGALNVFERKFITDDDTIVEQVTFQNVSDQPVQYKLRLSSGFARELDRAGSDFTTVDFEDIANAHPYPGYDILTGLGPEPFRAWYEAEACIEQFGSRDRDLKTGASNGEVLGAGFGNDRSHYAVIEFATPLIKDAHLYLRAATDLEKATRWEVSVDGKVPIRIQIEPAAGWGEKDEHFRWTHVELGEMIAGGHTLRLNARGEACNTNFDGFYIAGAEFDPSGFLHDRLPSDAIRQIMYRPGRQLKEGVPFQLIDPDRNFGRGVVMHPERNEGDRDDGDIVIPIPDNGANLIHFCVQIAGDRQESRTDPLAEYELRFDDQSTERILLTQEKKTQSLWRTPGVLTHRLPDDRALMKVIFRTGGSYANVALLGITLETYPKEGPACRLSGTDLFYGVRGHAVISAEGFLPDDVGSGLARFIRLKPGQAVPINITMGMTENLATSRQRASEWRQKPDAFEQHQQEYQNWFTENCPRFECDDPCVTRMYWYRWFVARHCLSRAAVGNLPDPYFFEGTHEGHFPRLIAFSSPHIINETRWLRNPEYAFGQVRNHCRNPDEESRFFISARADSKGGDYNNWITRTAWEAFWVHPDVAYLREVLPSLAADVLGTLDHFDSDEDYLPTPRNHWSTGMEFQPSFWYFTDYDDTQPDARLERGDFAAYLYGNANAVAQAYRFLGAENEAERFQKIADRIRESCLSKMWDDADRFCYAVREDDHAVARTREIVGFYPFMSGLIPDEPRYTATFAWLIDPDEFWTTYPPATASKSCPAYTPEIGVWPAAGGKRHDCMWNGPAWPHATSVILDVAAAAIQDYDQPHVTPDHFWHMFDRYTRIQFEEGDVAKPITHEYYNGETAFPEGVPDYFHSTYCDLVIKYLVGLQPANADEITIRSIPGPFSRFSLHGLRYRNHDIDIVYENRGAFAGAGRGLTVWIDGKRMARASALKPLTVKLPEPEQPREEPVKEVNIYGEEVIRR